MTTLHLIDASIYVFRAYYSMPDSFYDESGQLVHAVHGYANFLMDMRKKGLTHASVAFDESLTTCFRNDIYANYKANRDLPDENLKYQFEQCKTLTDMLGFHSLCFQDYEADDIIGSLCKKVGQDTDIVIVTRDKDLGQLLRENDLLWDFANNDYMGPADVEAKFGVPPEKIADFLALAGDSVDNIPGAPGIGAKTAALLIQEFGSLANLLENHAQVASSSMRGATRFSSIIAGNVDQLKLYRRITEIFCDIELSVSLEDLLLQQPSSALIEFAQSMKLSDRLVSRMTALGSQ